MDDLGHIFRAWSGRPQEVGLANRRLKRYLGKVRTCRVNVLGTIT